MITRKAKEEMIEKIAGELKQAQLIIITDYRGLNVPAINNLRRRLNEEQCSYRVVKNTLTRLACRRIGLEELESFMDGPNAIAYTTGDPVGAARVLLNFGKENAALSVKGGMLSGQPLQPEQIRALGEIPPREVLLSRLCAGFQAPIYGLASVLQGNIRQLVYAFDAVRRLKETA